MSVWKLVHLIVDGLLWRNVRFFIRFLIKFYKKHDFLFPSPYYFGYFKFTIMILMNTSNLWFMNCHELWLQSTNFLRKTLSQRHSGTFRNNTKNNSPRVNSPEIWKIMTSFLKLTHFSYNVFPNVSHGFEMIFYMEYPPTQLMFGAEKTLCLLSHQKSSA